MTALTAVLAEASRLATGSLVAAVWQGMLLAAVAWLGLRLLPKTPAAVRFAIWFGVFAVVVALPVVSLWPHAAARSGGHGAWVTVDPRWSVAIAAVWMLASVWRAGQLLIAAFRVRALWKRATPMDLEGANLVHPTLRDGAAKDGAPGLLSDKTTRRAPLCVSDEVDRPTVIGFFAPKIVIPGWLLEKLTLAELEQVVLHEAGHLGRADDWMNLVQKLALVVFPLNPALAWVERRLCFERELACDELVLRATGAPKAYAACLATLAEHRLQRRGLGLALAIGVLGRESELGQRVRRILRRGAQMKPLQARLVLGGAVLGLVVAATALERCPQLIGFSAGSPVQVAGNRDQGTGLNPGVTYGFRSVTLRAEVPQAQAWKTVRDGISSSQKPHRTSRTEQNQQVQHESVAGDVKAADVSAIAGRNGSGSAARMIRTARDSRDESQQGGDVVITQWTVTSWHGADGSRMVLTTTQVSSGLPRVQQDSESEAPQQQEVHPYAAVPVRGGWIVFQL